MIQFHGTWPFQWRQLSVEIKQFSERLLIKLWLTELNPSMCHLKNIFFLFFSPGPAFKRIIPMNQISALPWIGFFDQGRNVDWNFNKYLFFAVCMVLQTWHLAASSTPYISLISFLSSGHSWLRTRRRKVFHDWELGARLPDRVRVDGSRF